MTATPPEVVPAQGGDDMVAFAASDAACVFFPGVDQQPEREAFQRGAEFASRGPEGEAVRLLRAYHSAEDARNDCPECDNEGQWEFCSLCSVRIGDAINDQLLFLSSRSAMPGDTALRHLSAPPPPPVDVGEGG